MKRFDGLFLPNFSGFSVAFYFCGIDFKNHML